jgi:hypothetical protein
MKGEPVKSLMGKGFPLQTALLTPMWSLPLDAVLFEPVVQIGLGGVVALCDELLGGAIRQQAFYFRPKSVYSITITR